MTKQKFGELYRTDNGTYFHMCCICNQEYTLCNEIVQHIEIDHILSPRKKLILDEDPFIKFEEDNIISEPKLPSHNSYNKNMNKSKTSLREPNNKNDLNSLIKEKGDEMKSIYVDTVNGATGNQNHTSLKVPNSQTDLKQYAETQYTKVVTKCKKRAEYKCKICDKILKEKRYMLDHLYNKHFGRSPYKCEICDIQLCSAISLRKHCKSFHSTSKSLSSQIERRILINEDIINDYSTKLKPSGNVVEKFSDSDYINDSLDKNSLVESTNYHCTECNTNFSSVTLLQMHIKTIHLSLNLIQSTSNQSKIIEPKPSVIDKNEEFYNIPIEADLLQLAEMRWSVSISNHQKYQCNICDQRFRVKSYVIDHIYNKHFGRTPYICGICKKQTCSIRSLKQHELIHLKEKDMKIDKEQIKSFKKPLIVNCTQPCYYCDICLKEFSDKRCLLNHLFRHINYVPYKCEKCQKKFMSARNLHYHLDSKHGNNSQLPQQQLNENRREYKCNECMKSFNLKCSLTRHLKNHYSSNNLNQYKCTECMKNFNRQEYLTKHIKNHHSSINPKQYNCDKCPKAYITKAHLKEHQHLSHLNLRKFVCEHCGKTYFNSSGYKLHLRTRHTFEKPFNCDQCEQSFYTRRLLINHKHWHAGERPYKCKLCDKSYQNPRYLQLHMQLHENIKKYPCRHCDKSFVQSMKRRFHERTTHHVIPIYKNIHNY